MKLIHKLVIAFGVIVVVLAGLIATVMVSVSNMVDTTARAEHTFTVISEAEDVVKHFLSIESGYLSFVLSGEDNAKQPYIEGKEGVERNLKSLRQLTSDNPQQQQRLAKVEEVYQQWLTDAVEPPIEIRTQYGTGAMGLDQAAYIVKQGRGEQSMEQLRSLMNEFTATEEQLLVERTDAADAAANVVRLVVVIGGLLVAAVAVVSALLFKRQLETRINDAMRVATAIADGNLNSQIDDDGGDEIAELLSAMATMQTQLRNMMGEIKSASGELDSASQSVASTAEQLSASSDEQSKASNTIATSVQELSVSINHVADNAAEAKQISEQSGKNAEESAAIMEQMVAAMNRISDAVQQASGQLVELDKQSEQITSIVNVIKSIADQTNLLALNAAIEAARAGEQGRGFSVVADEVRHLAQRTSESTDEIETMVAKIQTGTQASVKQMQHGVQEVEEGVELASMTGQAINEIRESFDRVLQVVQDISNALGEQNAASDEVARNVERFSAMADQNQEATEHTSSTAHQLQTLAGKLGRAVSQFRF
ncbi:MAG: methyl-accepting chemotaxis protein [Pseudomonadota bacterium]